MSFFKKEDTNNNEEDVEYEFVKEYDGNTIEISFQNDNNNPTWKSEIHLLSGDLFPNKNFIYKAELEEEEDYRNNKKDKKLNKRKRKAIYPNTFLEQMIDYIIQILSYGEEFTFTQLITLLLSVFGFFGFLIYRYLYLKRRSQRLDFVDLALKKREQFIHSNR
ncbi:hypothetical protein ABK040_012306 [Willaertia magna]